MLALLVIALLLILILLGVPVSFAILGAGTVGLILIGGIDLVNGVAEVVPATSVMSYSLSAAPLFIFMANLVILSGLVDNLFAAARIVIGRLRGGTGVASVAAGAAFGAVSGSSTASAATLAQTSTVRMIEEGYEPKTASGLVAVVGTLAAMVPPSIILVFYAVTAEVSVGDVLIAGILPGAIIALGLIGTLYVIIARDAKAAPRGQRFEIKVKARALVQTLPILLLFGVVIGLVFFGVATPTEAAALGCVAALFLVVVRGRFTIEGFSHATLESIKTSTMILAIIIGAHIFGHFLTETRATPNLVRWVADLPVAPVVIMLIIMVFYIVLGFFMDQIAIIALTVPVVLPVVTELGYDPVWFGIFIVLLAEVGLVTPPLGLNAFVVARSARRNVNEVFLGAVPFVISMLVVALAFLFWPEIVLWVPNSR